MFTRDLTPNLKNSLDSLYPTKPEEVMKCVEIGSYEGGGKYCNNGYSL